MKIKELKTYLNKFPEKWEVRFVATNSKSKVWGNAENEPFCGEQFYRPVVFKCGLGDEQLLGTELMRNELNSMWIPVTEKLPETEGMMLVSCRTKKGAASVNRAYYADEFWHGSGSMSGVTAWMPLPEPYRED